MSGAALGVEIGLNLFSAMYFSQLSHNFNMLRRNSFQISGQDQLVVYRPLL
jgi:hypothetical protein